MTNKNPTIADLINHAGEHDSAVVADTMRTANMNAWLETEALKLGSDNQRERWVAGVLPDDELTAVARTELFKGFAEVHRWASRKHVALATHGLKHGKLPVGLVCRATFDHSTNDVELESDDVLELGPDEWATLKRVQALVEAVKVHPWIERSGSRISVESSTHWATCRVCGAEAFKSSVKVTIHWAGRELVREYAL